MANRYDIIHIDFQASARGANAAIESIRQEADKCNTRISELKKNIADAPKSGADAKIVEGWNNELKVTDRRYRQLISAQKELMKGMRALDEGVKMFNDGSLSAMNAAFQKQVNNAAKLAQSKLVSGSKEWRDMGALMQETEQNYARMQRDTDQLIAALQNGGTVFRKTLEDEKRGLQELLQVLPYMGTEYRKAEEQLQFLTKTTDDMTIKERQLKGEIVTADDARRVSLQLTKEGAEAARKRAEAADQEIEKGKQTIATLEEERKAREENARATADRAAKYREDQQMHEDEISRLGREIEKEQQLASAKKNGVEALKKKALEASETADKEVAAQQKANKVYDEANEKVEKLRKELADMGGAVQDASKAAAPGEAVRAGAEAAAEAVKKETEAKKEGVKVEEEAVETQKKEEVSLEELDKRARELIADREKLYAERKSLTEAQQEGIKAAEAEAEAVKKQANAYAELSKEEAQALLTKKQALATVTKGGDGKFAYTNAEEAQHFLIQSMRQINPANAKGNALSLDGEGVAKVQAMFKERYGIADDADAMAAIRGLLTGGSGSLIKGGMMNNAFSRIDLNGAAVAAYTKDIKDLTEVINGETKAVEENGKAKQNLERIEQDLAAVNKKIEANERESVEVGNRLFEMRNGYSRIVKKETQANEELADSNKKVAKSVRELKEEYKDLSKEEARAMKSEMTATSTIGWKGGKLDASNLEQIQAWIYAQAKKLNPDTVDGRGSVFKSMKRGFVQLGNESAEGGKSDHLDKLLSAFKQEYGLEGKEAKNLFKAVVSSSGGLFKGGGSVDFSSGRLDIPFDEGAYAERVNKLQALVSIYKESAPAIDKTTDSTKKNTEASKDAARAAEGQTDAIKAQEEEVVRLKKAMDNSSDEYEKRYAKLKSMKQKLSDLPKSGADALMARKELESDIADYDENFVKPARAEKNKMSGLWKKSVRKLTGMMGLDAEETNRNTEAENRNAEATERSAKSKRGKKKATEESASATAEETKKSAEQLAKEKELAEAETALADAKKKKEDQDKKTTDAIKGAETAAANADTAEKKHIDTLNNLHDEQEKHKADLEKLNEENKNTIATNEEAQKQLAETNAKIQEQGEKIRDAERIKAQAKTEGIEKTEQAIRILQDENRTIDTSSEKWEENARTIQHLQEALDEMKGKPALMMMEQRMKNVGALSASAVTETRRFWEAMVAGAAKGSESLKEAEAHLKTITEEEQKRTNDRNVQKADRLLNRGYLTMSEDEIRKSIAAAREYQQTLSPTEAGYKNLSNVIMEAENHLKSFGLEAQRSAQRQKEADDMMRQQLEQGTSLSESALRAQQQYWQRLIDDPKTAAESLEGYRKELEKTKELQDQQRETAMREGAAKLDGDLKTMSEGDIREAIEAGKQLIQTYESAGKDASDLARKIVAAEEHVKQYGVEAQRAAVREAKAVEEANRKRDEMNRLMVEQFNNSRDTMSDSALKANERYWQQLIDDPRTAVENLKEYRENLEIVQDFIKQKAEENLRTKGESALEFFRGTPAGFDSEGNMIRQDNVAHASADELKEQADALKKYRDSLPRDTEADKIEEINRYLEQVGMTAKGTTEEVMELDKALALADTAGKEGFLASPQEMQLATKALEKRREEVIKNIKANRDLGYATDNEEKELADLTRKLRDLKFEQDNFNMSQEKMQMLMETPKNAVNLDELRQAIKRADAELHRMEGSLGENSEEYQVFAEKVKAAKNVLKEMEGQAKASATAWEKAWSRLKTYVGLYMGFNILWQKLTGTFGDMMELSDKMGEVRKTTGFTADEVGRLSDNLTRLDVRTPLTQLMEIAAKAGQLGLKTEQDVMGFTEAANKLMIALPEMGAEAATEMMKVALATGEVAKIQDQINKGLVEGSSATEVALSKVGSVIDQLRANSAAAAPQITDFVKRVGAVGAQSGITIDQVAALGATVDAVGLRVEMSATALSRMIPAIKNNAFEVAKAIGMTPQALREMFDEAGGGMEAMLAIFQHIKDAGMDPDSIEKMLGMGGMQDVMKQLNQQGARAGIVFAGLSQNVDELRRNLGTAKEAYEDNIAILQEYNKMNDTTAAKWERLKNQLEEAIVSDTMQRLLGYVVTGLRTIVDLLTSNNGVSAAIRTILAYVGMLKLNLYGIIASIHTAGGGLKGILITLGLIDKETKKIQWGNIFTAAAAAIAWVVLELSHLKSALDKASDSLGETKEEVGRAIDRFEAYWTKLNSTSEALLNAKASHEKLSAEVDRLRKTTDGSAESTANLKKKEDELNESEKKVTKASNDHKSAISQMNGIYGKYLGFILTEANYANLAAAAHDKVTAAIEREMLMKQRQSAIGEVESGYANDIATGYGELNERLVQYGKLSRSEAAKAMSDMQKFMRENLKYDASKNATVVNKAVTDQMKKSGLDISKASANEIAGLWFDQYLKRNYHLSDKVRRGLTGVERRSDIDEGWGNVYTYGSNLRGDYGKTFSEREKSRGAVSAVYDVDITRAAGEEAKASGQLLANLEKSAKDAKKVILDKNVDEKKRNEAYGELANALEGLDNRINELDPKKDAATISRLEGMAKALKGEGIDIKKLKQAREKIHQTLFEKATFNEEDIKNLDTTNPWGGRHDAASTDWANMTAEQLVERRKQMKNFVNSIQTDSDVKAVLGEDAALQAAIRKGMSSDMRTVIEWYNTERLKIQDELYKRHLTNTGDWLDPKKSKESWRKQLQMDLDNYLKMLDAYYTKRKAEIQEAGNDEGLTEAEIRNRTLANDTEWQQRRMELQQIYLGKREEVAKDEVTAIMNILAEMDEDTPEMVEKLIGKSLDKWKILEQKAPEMARRLESKFVSGVSQSMLKMQQIVAQQMKAIQDIIDKERPFNGITKNLRENLVTMDILTADMRKEYRQLMKEGKDTSDFDRRQKEEEVKRTTFLLGEAEHAYTTTVEEVMARMGKAGMTAWAEEIRQSPKMQEALMAQLHQTYDAIQEAIKKEASLMKKQAETMWNNILLPGGDGKTTVKDAFEQTIAQLGVDQGRVSRANSLIGAGTQSERVADKLAIKQMQLQLTMEQHRYNLIRKQGMQRIQDLQRQIELAKKEGDIEKQKRLEQDKQHLEMSLNLAMTKEQTDILKQQEEIIARTEESQARLYKQLKEWGELIASSLQSVFEASNAGNAEYYNELAKMNLTGKGGPGAGTYVVIDNAGTEDAKAHYEYLDERAALERQHEIEQENAQAEAWKKVMDDINMKMSDQITDWLNASLQQQALDANTGATALNTEALNMLNQQLAQGINVNGGGTAEGGSFAGATDEAMSDGSIVGAMKEAFFGEGYTSEGGEVEDLSAMKDAYYNFIYGKMDADNLYANNAISNQNKVKQGELNSEKQMTAGSKNMYAAMMSAANLYGVAYQAMTNENLSAEQKFEMIALQAAGQSAMAMMSAKMIESETGALMSLPEILAKCLGINPIAGAAIFAVLSALIGAAIGAATSNLTKGKSEIAKVTGASASAGRLSTGMLTYAEGNVDEFTDPGSLTPGRQYNVDGADGRTYRARYMGSNPRTHLTNGPEFHLAGERGREMIIDAGTTRQITMNDNEIWHAIQTLSGGGRMAATRRRGRGVRAFADGNLDDFESVDSGELTVDSGLGTGFTSDQLAGFQSSLDKNNELLERALSEGIHARFDVYGKGGLIDSYDTGKKTVSRHGERY